MSREATGHPCSDRHRNMAPRQHTGAGSSNDKEITQPPQNDNETSQTQESHSAELALNHQRSRTRKKYDDVTRERVAKVREVGACHVCRVRKVRVSCLIPLYLDRSPDFGYSVTML